LFKEAGLPLVRLWRYTTVLSMHRTTTVNNRFRRSHSVDNSCGLTPSRTGGCINIWKYFI